MRAAASTSWTAGAHNDEEVYVKLLKIGDRMVNMDLVTDIRLYVDGINLYLMSNSGGNEAMLEVRGAEAEALRRWLEERAEDVTTPPELVSHGGS